MSLLQKASEDGFADSDTNTVFTDTLLAQVAAFLMIAVLLLALISPQGKDQQASSVVVGNVLVELTWPQEHDADVDLWVMGPDRQPIGYSNLVGEVFNLLRDDLGKSEHDFVNYESALTRGIRAGGYCVNVHFYSDRSGVLPMPYSVSVRVNKGEVGTTNAQKGSVAPVLTHSGTLLVPGLERNVWCFKLTADGEVDGETFTSQEVSLRSPGKFLPF